jgi:cytochrome c oxidase subunit 2
LRKALGIAVVAGTVLLVGNLVAQPQNSAATAPPVQVIEMTAKKYEYTPGEIRVKKGTRVQLKIRALDRTHGFKLSLYAEGAPEKGTPGLKVEPQQDNWKLEKDQERIIEFVAEQAGTYTFKCSNFCGFGHRGMKGKLVVEE